MTYKILFIGLGSIGKRRLRNVTKYLSSRGHLFYIDALRSSLQNKLPDEICELLRYEFFDIKEIPADYDIIFITNPTSMHLSTIEACMQNTRHMFIEKPFSNTYIDINKIHFKSDSVYYIACPLRYNPVLQYIKKNIDPSQIIAVRSISSSYLPAWRPGQDYRQTYSAHKDLGGGVSIDLIHEWDYLIWLLGAPDSVKSLTGKISDLDIDSDDIAIYMAKKNNLFIELHLDYFGRKTLRELHIFLNDQTVIADILNKKIMFYPSKREITFSETKESIHLAEIDHFFSILEGDQLNDNSPRQAMETLRVALG